MAYAMAYITLTPIALLVFYASVAVSRRELISLIMLVGQLTNELVNAVLKEYFQIKRPYGMTNKTKKEPKDDARLIVCFCRSFGDGVWDAFQPCSVCMVFYDIWHHLFASTHSTAEPRIEKGCSGCHVCNVKFGFLVKVNQLHKKRGVKGTNDSSRPSGFI